MHPVEKAVTPLKDDAKQRAEQETREYIERARAELEAADWDINAVAPYPRGMGYGVDHHMARFKYENYHAIVKTCPERGKGSYRPGEPAYVIMDAERSEKFVQRRIDAAAAQYEAFVAKLVQKIGDCLSAKLEGNHVWSHSILVVTKKDKSIERWKTQQIVNVSKLGRHFNQWPTRKMKEKAA